MVSAALWFTGGIFAGLAIAALGVIVALLLPDHPRDSVWPQFFAAVGDRPLLHPDSAAHGATPHDWSGSVWNPPRREVPYRIVKTELI